jgi:membrane protease YdiL (CAAX protease family)
MARLLHQPANVALHPVVLLATQLWAYVIAFFCARIIIEAKTGRSLMSSIEWNFPASLRVPHMLFGGILLAIFVLASSQFLPMPKGLPVEKMFQTRTSAIGSMLFAILVAPLAEEVFFRGILWGGIHTSLGDARGRRRLAVVLFVLTLIFAAVAARGGGSAYGMFAPLLLLTALFVLMGGVEAATFDARNQRATAVVLTGAAFAFVHGAQLGNSWAPVLVILVVGLVLTTARALLNSVAASWIMHTGYNGTLFLLMWAQTQGFRKLGG